jgi:hypothetical protein
LTPLFFDKSFDIAVNIISFQFLYVAVPAIVCNSPKKSVHKVSEIADRPDDNGNIRDSFKRFVVWDCGEANGST